MCVYGFEMLPFTYAPFFLKKRKESARGWRYYKVVRKKSTKKTKIILYWNLRVFDMQEKWRFPHKPIINIYVCTHILRWLPPLFKKHWTFLRRCHAGIYSAPSRNTKLANLMSNTRGQVIWFYNHFTLYTVRYIQSLVIFLNPSFEYSCVGLRLRLVLFLHTFRMSRVFFGLYSNYLHYSQFFARYSCGWAHI